MSRFKRVRQIVVETGVKHVNCKVVMLQTASVYIGIKRADYGFYLLQLVNSCIYYRIVIRGLSSLFRTGLWFRSGEPVYGSQLRPVLGKNLQSLLSSKIFKTCVRSRSSGTVFDSDLQSLRMDGSLFTARVGSDT